MNQGLTSHLQLGHTKTGPHPKDHVTPELVVQHVIHYTTPVLDWEDHYRIPLRNILQLLLLEKKNKRLSQCIFDFEIRKKQMFTEARAFSRVTYFLFSGEPAGFFLKLT